MQNAPLAQDITQVGIVGRGLVPAPCCKPSQGSRRPIQPCDL
jgi:hypothetical protein